MFGPLTPVFGFSRTSYRLYRSENPPPEGRVWAADIF